MTLLHNVQFKAAPGTFEDSLDGMALVFYTSLKAQVKDGIITQRAADLLWAKDRREHGLIWNETQHKMMAVFNDRSDLGVPYVYTITELADMLPTISKTSIAKRLTELMDLKLIKAPARSMVKYRRRTVGKLPNNIKLYGIPFKQTPELKHDMELARLDRIDRKCIETLALNSTRANELHKQRRSQWTFKASK